MKNELRKRKIPFKSQQRIGERFVCDFIIPSSELAIECEGDYWHANPNIYDRYNPSKLSKIQKHKLELDIYKEEYLTRNGWQLVRFFESDINQDIEKCVNKIEARINKITFERIGDIWEMREEILTED